MRKISYDNKLLGGMHSSFLAPLVNVCFDLKSSRTVLATHSPPHAQCLNAYSLRRRDAAGETTGQNWADAVSRAWYSSSASWISAAATLLSSCSRLDAPGIAATTGRWMTQESAICAGVAECASATSRRTAIRGLARSMFSGKKYGLVSLNDVRRAISPVISARQQPLR